MKIRARRIAALLLPGTIAAVVQVGAQTGAVAVPAAFDRAVVPASGSSTSLLTIGEFGRYSIAAESASGTALRIVDRMAGAGELAGASGERDGRIDLFLDRGEVRVVTEGARLATGEARLSARRFADRSPATPERLVEGRLITSELADLEERSWWLEVEKSRRVTIEAAGRALADLRLWQNGSWLVDALPEGSRIDPVAGEPLTLLRWSAELGPGLYRLAAYGGEPLPWSRESGSAPLYLRAGLARDPIALSERRAISPFGFDTFVVGGAADHFRFELDAPAAASLAVADFDADQPFEAGYPGAWLDKEALPPVATLEPSPIEGDRIVTVTAAAGTPYLMRHFARGRERRIAKPARYWISTVTGESAADVLDGTAIVVDPGDGKKRAPAVVAADVPKPCVAGWAGRFNLFERSTLHFQVDALCELELRSHGSPLQARVEPFFLSPPDGYAQPPSRPAPAVWSLDPGYYVLELTPVERGIAEVELVAKGAARLAPTPRGPARLGELELAPNREWVVLLNERPGVAAGLVVRELPLDLVAALPVAVRPGEQLAVPFRAPAASRLEARGEDGGALEIAVDDGAFSSAASVEKGSHVVRVRSSADRTASASLALTPLEREAGAGLPPVSPEALASQPLFETLTAGAPRTFDLAANGSATFGVRADEAALYRIETRGLLATEAALRTRTVPRLVADAENGSGRNVRLAAYLREGEYQLTVRPRGASAGHLGLAVERSPIDDGGRLPVVDPAEGPAPAGASARATLAPGRAVSYAFDVTEPGAYRVVARGLARDFRLRLEDGAGWPVAEPSSEGEQVSVLAPGAHRLIVLPQPVEARVTVGVERVREDAPAVSEEPAKAKPVAIALDRVVERIWREGGAEARADDRFRFDLPAPTSVAVALTPEMEGELHMVADRTSDAASSVAPTPLGRIKPGRALRIDLERGTYELRLRAVRRDEGRRYTFAVRPEAWVDGSRRTILPPVDLAVAVGEAGVVELASFGGIDLKARLFDAAGNELASGDDRPGDWNFRISRRLEPGEYRLRVEASGSNRAARVDRRGALSEVAMRIQRERELPPVGMPSSFGVELDDRAALVALTIPSDAELVAVGARGDENIAISLEERQGETWRALAESTGNAATVALPLARERGELRLRLAALDRRPVRVRVTANATGLARFRESDLARGITLPLVPGLDPAVAAAAVDLAAPGCFRRTGDAPLLQALALGSPFAPAAPTLAPVGMTLPLAAASGSGELPAAARVIRATRALIGDGTPLALTLPAGIPVLCDVADGAAAMVEVVATGGEPVVGFVSDSGDWGASTALDAAGSSRAAAAAPAGKGRAVELWNAAELPVEARVDGWLARELRGDGAEIGAALTSWTVPAGAAISVELPKGEKLLQLAVAAGGGALVTRGGEPRGFVRASGESRSERLASDADRALLFGERLAAGATNAGTGTLVGVAIEPARASGEGPPGGAPATLAAGGRFERRFAGAGRFRLPVPPAAGATRIELEGVSDAALVAVDGSVRRGASGGSIEVPATGGELRFAHPAGFAALARVASSAQAAESAAVAAAAPARRLALPAIVSLNGDELALETDFAAPALLSLRSAGSFAISVSTRGRTVVARSFAAGARVDVVVEAGTTRIGLRGLAGEPLFGDLVASASPLVAMGEGLGEARLVAAGESRAFVFRVPAAGVAGVGVRSDLPGVETRLLDAAGEEVGRGVAIWTRLAAGEHRLIVDVPHGEAPATIRTALVGTTPPGDGPPQEQIERFLELAGQAPAPPARTITGSRDRPEGEPAEPENEDEGEGGEEPENSPDDESRSGRIGRIVETEEAR